MSAKKPETEKVGNVAPFGLRMLPSLKEKIAASAEARGRSMNAEIVDRLEMSFIDRDSAGAVGYNRIRQLQNDTSELYEKLLKVADQLTVLNKLNEDDFDRIWDRIEAEEKLKSSASRKKTLK